MEYNITLTRTQLIALQDAVEWAEEMDENPQRFDGLQATLDQAWVTPTNR